MPSALRGAVGHSIVMKPSSGVPARMGSLHTDVHRGLLMLRGMLAERDRAFMDAFGGIARRSHLRDEITRIALIEFGNQSIQSIGFYQRECRAMASASGVRNELGRMHDMGVVILQGDRDDHRYIDVVPTQGLVDWASEEVIRLAAMMRGSFIAR